MGIDIPKRSFDKFLGVFYPKKSQCFPLQGWINIFAITEAASCCGLDLQWITQTDLTRRKCLPKLRITTSSNWKIETSKRHAFSWDSSGKDHIQRISNCRNEHGWNAELCLPTCCLLARVLVEFHRM